MSNFYYNAKTEETIYRYKMLNVVRKDKFNFIMPRAMRDNNIDMWIHVMKRGVPDPFELDFGVYPDYFLSHQDYATVYIVFTDRGGDRIERALFGTGTSVSATAGRSVYDIFGAEGDFAKHVAERNPKHIAVNMSEWLPHLDTLSYTGYFKLCKMLGDENAKKLVSSEKVLTDFRVRRVQSEIILFAKACAMQRDLMESAYKNLIPGVTRKEDMSWYGQGWLLDKGIENYYYGINRLPQIMHSCVSDPSKWNDRDYIYQRGDLIKWDWGIDYLNFGTDFKRWAYILREGEEDLPTSVQHAWDQAVKAREVLRKTIKSGPTALETLGIVNKAIEDAGFVSTPFANTAEDKEIIASLGDSEKTGFSMDCHCVGNSGGSQVAVGPSVSPFRKDRAHLKIEPNHLIAFEFTIHSWIPEWNKRLMINLEEDALVTERGVESLYPSQEKIILIR